MEYFRRLWNVCVFILIWLGVPWVIDVWPLVLLTWIPALLIHEYLNPDEYDSK